MTNHDPNSKVARVATPTVFVTVGTHEQGFDRLINAVIDLAKRHPNLNIRMQYGYTDVDLTALETVDNLSAQQFIPADEMATLLTTSDILISHGGPATYMPAVSANKQVIVVPRLSEFNEHVNNHQISFANQIMQRTAYEIACVVNIDDLDQEVAKSVSKLTSEQHDPAKSQLPQSNTANFNKEFASILERYI